MKKVLLGLVFASLFLLSGCEKIEGNYKKGVYFGSKTYVSQGKNYVTTAVVTVSESGMLESVFIDTTYFKDDVYTTKKVLGDAYGMAKAEGQLEWYEQINALEAKILEEQGLEWFSYSNDEQTDIDSVSGVTISVNNYHDAVKMALDAAKK